jgi:hypothetical protein
MNQLAAILDSNNQLTKIHTVHRVDNTPPTR